MIIIPVGQRYTTTVEGGVWKACRCAKCGCAFTYFLRRAARGGAPSLLWLNNDGARRESAATAHAALEQSLRRDCDPVPCPDCGWYQVDMVARARKNLYAWVKTAAILVPVISLMLVPVGSFFVTDGFRLVRSKSPEYTALLVTTIALILASPAVLLLGRQWLVNRYDPNDPGATPPRSGSGPALRRAGFEGPPAQAPQRPYAAYAGYQSSATPPAGPS